MTMKLTTLLVLAGTAFGAQAHHGEEHLPNDRHFACRALGGGYLTQDLKVSVQGDRVDFELARYSEVAPEMGLGFFGTTVKSAKFSLPKARCHFGAIVQRDTFVVSCENGIDKVEAEVTYLDGRRGTLALQNNRRIEIYRQENTGATSGTTSAALRVRLDHVETLGFNLRNPECAGGEH